MLANYAYDSWGKVTEITGNTALAGQNPIRYRSYYFDFETEWYFLNTRYYSPDMCRFISSDDSDIVDGSNDRYWLGRFYSGERCTWRRKLYCRTIN